MRIIQSFHYEGWFMVERVGTVRMNISLSQGLKRRMGVMKDEVNWSAIAARAFEEKLAAIATAKEKKSMDDVEAPLPSSHAELRGRCPAPPGPAAASAG